MDIIFYLYEKCWIEKYGGANHASAHHVNMKYNKKKSGKNSMLIRIRRNAFTHEAIDMIKSEVWLQQIYIAAMAIRINAFSFS